MSYSKNRQKFAIPLAPARTDADVLLSLFVPANQTVVIHALEAYMSTAGSAAGCGLDLEIDGAVVDALNLTTANSTGHKSNPLTAPYTVSGGAAGVLIQVLQETTDAAGIGTAILDIEVPFSAFAEA
jgi:hypothetical protein